MTQFWINDPTILLNKYSLTFWPTESMSMNEKLNAMTRLIIVLSLLGFICFNRSLFLVMGLILVGAIVLIYKRKGIFEGMEVQPTQPILPNNPVNNVFVAADIGADTVPPAEITAAK